MPGASVKIGATYRVSAPDHPYHDHEVIVVDRDAGLVFVKHLDTACDLVFRDGELI